MDETEDFNKDIDISWINEFEKMERYYKCPLETIKVNYLYIGEKGEIETISQDSLTIKENKISQEELIYIIKQKQKRNYIYYKLHSIFKYNISCESEDIINYISQIDINEGIESIDNKDTLFKDCLKQIHNLNTIFFDDTIKYFQNLNSLYILFYKHRENNTKQTKKIRIHTQSKNKTRNRKQ